MSTRAPAPPRRRRPARTQRAPAREQRAPARARGASRRRSAPAIDPRIRARRIAVAREAGRRRLRRLLVLLALVTLTGAVAIVMWSPLLDVDRVVVAGAGPRAAAVRAAAEVEPGSALLLVSTGDVEDRVEALAWVSAARATRELPGTMRITVTERPPVGSSRVDLQACKLEYSIVSPK